MSLKCVVCGGDVVLRVDDSRPRKTDGTFSCGMNGWVCFGCQCDAPPMSERAEPEDTLPTFDPDWPSVEG